MYISKRCSPCEHASHMQIYLQYQHTQSNHMKTQSQHPNSLRHSGPFHLQDAAGIAVDLCLYQDELGKDTLSQWNSQEFHCWQFPRWNRSLASWQKDRGRRQSGDWKKLPPDWPWKQLHPAGFSLQIGQRFAVLLGTSGIQDQQLQSILGEICTQDRQSAQSLLMWIHGLLKGLGGEKSIHEKAHSQICVEKTS